MDDVNAPIDDDQRTSTPPTVPSIPHGAQRDRLRRRRAERVLAGVAGGIADHLAIPVLWVRAAFAVLAAFAGAGIVAYAFLWVFVPQRSSAAQAARGGERVSPRERQQGMGLAAVGMGLALATSSFGAQHAAWVVGPLAVALLGVAVVWREADETQRSRWRKGARAGVADVIIGDGRRSALLRVAAGVVLVFVGMSVFLSGSATMDALPFALLSVAAALLGAAVLTVPWWLRLVRDLNVERSARIRSQERAEIAAHLHDSVLQTLALIQKQADSSREVRRLARGQERELRGWLYGTDGYGGAGVEAPATTLSQSLAKACGEVEDSFAVTVEQVVVGDCDLDERLAAQIAAGREAMVNAAKHAGVTEISVYAEVEPEHVRLFVKDRGAGFDPDNIDGDRHGIADSIRGRMKRHGGQVRLRTEVGRGTEVALEMPKKQSQ